MNREIKFRAYLKDKKEMLDLFWFEPPSKPDKTGWGHLDIFHLWPRTKNYMQKHREDVEIMQFTGLKDRSGIEIYEGDIVSLPYYCCCPKCTVIFQNGRFGVDKQLGFLGDRCEVIGNIYQNPDLLT